MVARKPAAKKPAAKKTAAKKTAAPAKKSGSASSDAAASDKQIGDAVTRICENIENGGFDGHLQKFDDALTKRINAQNAAKRAAAKKTAEKRVAAPPKKAAPAAPKTTVEPEPGKTYGIKKTFKQLAGAKVKFVRFKAETDGAKSIVEMMSDVPGNPKGKKVAIPTSALEAAKK